MRVPGIHPALGELQTKVLIARQRCPFAAEVLVADAVDAVALAHAGGEITAITGVVAGEHQETHTVHVHGDGLSAERQQLGVGGFQMAVFVEALQADATPAIQQLGETAVGDVPVEAEGLFGAELQ